MSKFVTPIILIVLAIGTYFTFTTKELDKAKVIQDVNNEYITALRNADELIKQRDKVNLEYSKLTAEDKENLDIMLPDTVDNVKLIIDVDDIAKKNGFSLRNVRTSATGEVSNRPNTGGQNTPPVGTDKYNVVTLSFNVNAKYEDFLNFLRELEMSLRIMDISKITLTSSDTGIYDFGVELKTYWLKI